MWTEITKNGKYKFCEQIALENGKKIKACVTYDKNTRTTQKAAQLELHEKLEKKKQENPTLNTLTLKQLVDMYMNECETKHKDVTLRNKRYAYNCLMRNIGENTKVSKLDHLTLNSYCVNLPKATLGLIKALLNWAYLRGYIDTKLADRLYTLNDSKRERDKLYLEPTEIQEVLSLLEQNQSTHMYKTLRLLIEFLTLTGIRIGEALALTKSDINEFDVTINKTLTIDNTINSAKTIAGNRTITINNRAKQILAEMDFLKRMKGINSDIVFSNTKGKYTHYNNLRLALYKVTGIKGFHIFRHTHASLLASEGISLDAIQRRLGHESDEITRKVYVHVTEKQREADKILFRGLDII